MKAFRDNWPVLVNLASLCFAAGLLWARLEAVQRDLARIETRLDRWEVKMTDNKVHFPSSTSYGSRAAMTADNGANLPPVVVSP